MTVAPLPSAALVDVAEQRALWVLDDGLILGGGQLFALRVARWAGRPVRLVCPAGSELWERAAAQGVPCLDVAFPSPAPRSAGALAAATRRLHGVLAPARMDRDVIVSGGIRCSLVGAAALAVRRDAPPLVHLLHERDSAARPSVRAALRRSRRLVAVGSLATGAYREALPRARVIQANNFLAPDTLTALAGLRTARGAAAVPPRLGVLARVIPEKGIAALVGELAARPEAWASLTVAGPLQDAAEVARVRAAIAASGLGDRLRLAGPTDDVPGFLSRIDVLVVPSTGNEAQPTTILEALAAGVPVVARAPIVSTDFAGLPVTAYRSPDELAAALAAPPAPAAAPTVLAHRFGPDQAVAAIEEAAA